MRGVGVLVVLVSMLASNTAAQESESRVYLMPKLGVFTSVSTLAEIDGRKFDLDSNPAIGLSVEVTIPRTRFGVRANLAYQTGTELLSEGDPLSDDDNTLLVVTADLVYRLSGDTQVRPYLLGGLGAKHYELEVPSVRVLNGSATDFTIHAGLGVGINVGFGAVIAELSDYISWFKPEDRGSSKMQNDIFGLVGIRIGLF